MNIKTYFEDYTKTLNDYLSDPKNQGDLQKCVTLIQETDAASKKIILVGNGGSAAIAEHMATDFTKNAGLRAISISGSPILTTFANDYGYEYVYSKGVEAFGDEGDLLIAISSGGGSKNILNAVESAKSKGMKSITFSGFNADNPLRTLGDINIWVNSRAYGYVEIIHNLLIHYLNDQIIGSAVYQFR